MVWVWERLLLRRLNLERRAKAIALKLPAGEVPISEFCRERKPTNVRFITTDVARFCDTLSAL